jgi:MFS family permease
MTTTASTRWSFRHHRDFFLFLSARGLSSMAIRIQAVAVGWQVYEATHLALDLGLVSLALFLPFIVLVLPAGHVADNVDRRYVAAGCVGLQMLCALAFLWLSWHGFSSVWPVCVVMAFFGASRAFYIPVMQALVPNLVDSTELNRAVTLNATITQIALVVGPALGGVLYLLGPVALYWIVASIFAATVLMLLTLRRGAPLTREREPASWSTLLSGLHFVRSKPVILGAMSLDLFAVLFGGATALLPIYASDILHVGPEGLGLLRAAPGIGASLCAFWLTANPITRHVGRWMLYAVGFYGAATLVFGLATHFIIALVALFASGAADMVNVYIRNMLIQLETPDAIRGRVNAVSAVFIGASNELGEFESGLLASWVGAVRSVVIGGVLTLSITAYWSKLFPELRKMDRFS